MAEVFALQAAFCFAISHIFIRRGMVDSNAITASFFSLTMSAVVLWVLVPFFVPLSAFWTPAVFYFIVAGVFAPGLGRTLNFVGIERIGVPRAVPIVNSSPIFASIFAVLFLGEVWVLQNIVGTTLVILGVVTLSSIKPAHGQWRKMDVIYPVLGAISFGISANLRRGGLLVADVPIMAAAVTTSAAFLFAIGLLQAKGGRRSLLIPRRSLAWYLAAGLFNTTASLLTFFALSSGKVVIVEPLIASNPVLSLILTAVFLRDLEVISVRVVVGALCTVAGSILVVTV
jgi:uncharacterized membrane protein